MDRKVKGRLAEAKAIAHLTELEYDVYTPLYDNCKYDLIVVLDGVPKKVSVKYTSCKTKYGWAVNLRNTYRIKDGAVKENNFDSSEHDLLVVYIGPEDRVEVLECDFPNKTGIIVK